MLVKYWAKSSDWASLLYTVQYMSTNTAVELLSNTCASSCPVGSTGAKGTLYSASRKEVSLVYFSTCEPINLTPDSIMQQAGVLMLNDSASTLHLPCLYICPVANVLGCAPSILCFICCNSHHMIPHHQHLGSASAGTQLDRGNSSRLYVVNIWWHYGRSRPWMVSIAEAERIMSKCISKSRIRAGETRKRCSKAAAAPGAAEGDG
jgi:hypothetical protein